jgi:hypothetical protein
VISQASAEEHALVCRPSGMVNRVACVLPFFLEACSGVALSSAEIITLLPPPQRRDDSFQATCSARRSDLVSNPERCLSRRSGTEVHRSRASSIPAPDPGLMPSPPPLRSFVCWAKTLCTPRRDEPREAKDEMARQKDNALFFSMPHNVHNLNFTPGGGTMGQKESTSVPRTATDVCMLRWVTLAN